MAKRKRVGFNARAIGLWLIAAVIATFAVRCDPRWNGEHDAERRERARQRHPDIGVQFRDIQEIELEWVGGGERPHTPSSANAPGAR